MSGEVPNRGPEPAHRNQPVLKEGLFNAAVVVAVCFFFFGIRCNTAPVLTATLFHNTIRGFGAQEC